MELKLLPDTLKYAFLGDSKTMLVIISSHLNEDQEGKLLDVLSEHKETLGWTIANIKGISSSIVMHQIHLKENAKTLREPQRRSERGSESGGHEIVRCRYHLSYLR